MVRDACAQIPPGVRIRRLTIIVGEASGHDARHIQSHFDEASRGTPAENASLDFVVEKLSARCAVCGTNFVPTGSLLACTKCGGTELTITAGHSVRLATVEAG